MDAEIFTVSEFIQIWLFKINKIKNQISNEIKC